MKQYDVDGLISNKPSQNVKDTASADTSKVDTTKTDKVDSTKTDKKDTTKTDKVDSTKTDKADSSKTDKADSSKTDKDNKWDSGQKDDDVKTIAIANKGLLLAVEKTYSVYNMKGAFVCNLKATRIDDVQVQLNSMRLEKGLYVVKDGYLNRVFSVK